MLQRHAHEALGVGAETHGVKAIVASQGAVQVRGGHNACKGVGLMGRQQQQVRQGRRQQGKSQQHGL